MSIAQHISHTFQQVHKAEHTLLNNAMALGLASFFAFWRSSPESVTLAAVGASLMILLDTLFGIAGAAFFREFRSRKLRERLVAKVLYYTLFISCSYIIAGLLRAYWMMLATWYAILLIELVSIGETLTRLHVRGGKRFGPAERLLKTFAKAMGEAAQAALPDEKSDEKKDETK